MESRHISVWINRPAPEVYRYARAVAADLDALKRLVETPSLGLNHAADWRVRTEHL